MPGGPRREYFNRFRPAGYLTTGEFAELTGKTRGQIASLINSLRLPYLRISRLMFIHESHIATHKNKGEAI